ncbi:MAG TPA: hemolysin III family protein [Burkholderiaceae bacterium]|jgi:hemolysin III|nr:hemolysin III family protein [Burkholderiaceae bacterium]
MYYGERFNSISHLTGAVLAAVGTTLLLVMAARLGDLWKIVSFSVYGAMLLTLYIASTLYHGLRGPAKPILRKIDHCAIYLLIAGSYTPFTLVSLRGVWGWSLFGVVWSLALIGILQEIWYAAGARILSLTIYLLMGWLALIALDPLVSALTWTGFAWLVAGGLVYTTGMFFYVAGDKVRHGHGMWHMFVLGGSACHYFVVFFYVA